MPSAAPLSGYFNKGDFIKMYAIVLKIFLAIVLIAIVVMFLYMLHDED